MSKSQVPSKEIIAEASLIAEKQLSWRRHLHQYPETANLEFKTTTFLAKLASGIKLKRLPIKMKTGLLLELSGDRSGPTVAIRSDIDALPITEMTGLPFKSKHEGTMHACGHDMHMATVMGTAHVLAKLKKDLAGTVRFIFQPAEEQPPGGARPMIENGALKNVERIFGMHVDPHLKTGQISVRDGITMAAVTDFDLVIRGRGGHAARPHFAIDAIVTAAEVIDSIQKIVSRETDPTSPIVITFGKIEGGTARNVIADEVRLTGTARCLSKKLAKEIPGLIKRTAEGVCRARGAKAEMTLIANYPVLSNDTRTNRFIEQSYRRLFPKGTIAETPAMLGGEDFACYLEKVPGAMFRLGVMNKKIKAVKSWHSPQFIADEAALPCGTAVLTAAVLDFLQLQSS